MGLGAKRPSQVPDGDYDIFEKPSRQHEIVDREGQKSTKNNVTKFNKHRRAASEVIIQPYVKSDSGNI